MIEMDSDARRVVNREGYIIDKIAGCDWDFLVGVCSLVIWREAHPERAMSGWHDAERVWSNAMYTEKP